MEYHQKYDDISWIIQWCPFSYRRYFTQVGGVNELRQTSPFETRMFELQQQSFSWKFLPIWNARVCHVQYILARYWTSSYLLGHVCIVALRLYDVPAMSFSYLSVSEARQAVWHRCLHNACMYTSHICIYIFIYTWTCTVFLFWTRNKEWNLTFSCSWSVFIAKKGFLKHLCEVDSTCVSAQLLLNCTQHYWFMKEILHQLGYLKH